MRITAAGIREAACLAWLWRNRECRTARRSSGKGMPDQYREFFRPFTVSPSCRLLSQLHSTRRIFLEDEPMTSGGGEANASGRTGSHAVNRPGFQNWIVAHYVICIRIKGASGRKLHGKCGTTELRYGKLCSSMMQRPVTAQAYRFLTWSGPLRLTPTPSKRTSTARRSSASAVDPRTERLLRARNFTYSKL